MPDQKKTHFPKTSRKAPAVRNEVIARRLQGQPKTSIARDLGISKNTVVSIIEMTDIDRMIEDGRLSASKLIPKGFQAIEYHLEKNNLRAAEFIIGNTVFSEHKASEARPMRSDVNLLQTIQLLVNPPKEPDTKTINAAAEQDNQSKE